MSRVGSRLASIAVLVCGFASASLAMSPEEERLLGCGCEQAALESLLPFTRAIGVSGIVRGSLARSAVEAGISAAVTLEATEAFATAIDLERDLHDGDRFYLRYEQTYTLAGAPIGVGRVLWVELRSRARGVIALHRFKPAGAAQDSLWLASGQGTLPPRLGPPLDKMIVTSGFGLRADPLDQPMARMVPMGPLPDPAKGRAAGGLQPSPLGEGALGVNAPTPAGLALGLAPVASRLSGFNYQPRFYQPRFGGAMALHAGVDLLADPGTPIHAAGDGVVLGAQPNGRYGNWIEIDHGDKLATVYGHLAAFAPGIVPGAHVREGDVIGFSGNTGRTTGPHLHFEILTNGRPGNPIGNPAIKHAQLRGPDLERLRKVVAQDVAERDRESKSM